MSPTPMKEHDQMSANLFDEGSIDASAATAAGSSAVMSHAQQSDCALDESRNEGAEGGKSEEGHASGRSQVDIRVAEAICSSVPEETEHASREEEAKSFEKQPGVLRKNFEEMSVADESASRTIHAEQSGCARDEFKKGATLSVRPEGNQELGCLRADGEAVKNGQSSVHAEQRVPKRASSLSLEKQRSLFHRNVAQLEVSKVSRHEENLPPQGARDDRARADRHAGGFGSTARGDKGIVVPVDYAYGLPSDFDELPSHGFEVRRRFHVKPASPSVPGEWRPVMHGKIKHGVALVEASSGALCWTTGGAARPDGKAWMAVGELFPKSPPKDMNG